MSEDTRDQAEPALSAAALGEWNDHVAAVLRGIAHALNNRAAALSAVIELSEEPAEEPSVTSSILATELERVRELTAVVRSLGAPRNGVEAFAPSDAASEALAVLRLHAEQRDRMISIDANSAPPIRMPRWMFVRSLIVLGAGASRGSANVKLVVVEDGEWVVTRVDGPDSPPSGITPYVLELACAMGGGPLAGRYGFRVPTLAALRQREGREA